MWESGAARLRRTWTTILPSRWSLTSSPKSPTWDGDTTPAPAPPAPHTAYPWTDDGSLVAAFRQLLSDFDTIHTVNGAPLTDPRVQDMRRWVDDAIPRLYFLAAANLRHSFEAKRVAPHAENFLRRFPGVDVDRLRAKHIPHPPSPPADPASPRRPRDPAAPFVPATQPAATSPAVSPPPRGAHPTAAAAAATTARAHVSPETVAMLSAVHDMLGTSPVSVFDAPPAQSPQEIHQRLSQNPQLQLYVRDVPQRLAFTPEVQPYTSRT